jgi:hypothetical protein
MVRAVLGFFGGYAVVVVIVMAGFLLLPTAIGVDRVLKPGSYETSTTGIGIVGSVAGGAACALIARPRSRAPLVLAGVMLVLGLVTAFMQPEGLEGEAAVRPADEPPAQSIMSARKTPEPPIIRYSNPFVGALGVLAGSLLVPGRRRRQVDEGASAAE